MELIKVLQEYNDYLVNAEIEAAHIFNNTSNYSYNDEVLLLEKFYDENKNELYKKETFKNIRNIISNVSNKSNNFSIIYLYQYLYEKYEDINIFYTILENITDNEIIFHYDWLITIFSSSKLNSDNEQIKILFKYCQNDKLYNLFYKNFGYKIRYFMSDLFKLEDENNKLQKKVELLEAENKEMKDFIDHCTYAPDGPGYELAKKDFQKHLEGFK